jgi:hypothetical protein
MQGKLDNATGYQEGEQVTAGQSRANNMAVSQHWMTVPVTLPASICSTGVAEMELPVLVSAAVAAGAIAGAVMAT